MIWVSKTIKFIIQYILEEKHRRANSLSKKNNHIKIKKIFNYSILKFNKNKLLLVNKN